MPLNQSQTRLVDPVLSTRALGYRSAARVGSLIFPAVPVDVSGGQIVQFGKEAFVLYQSRRQPGGSVKQIDFGYLGVHYQLLQDSLDAKIPREMQRDAAAVPGIDMGMRAVNVAMNSLTLVLENDQATIATQPANYDANHKLALSGTTKWSTTTGTPVDDIENAKEAVRASTGNYPNVMVMAPAAYKALKKNQQIVDRFKYTSAGAVIPDMLAALFEMEAVAVGKSVIADPNTGAFSDVWGNNVVLAYSPQASDGMEEPSFGYTYTMRDHPFVEAPRWDGGTRSWIYGVNYERLPVLTGMTAGFLIQNPN